MANPLPLDGIPVFVFWHAAKDAEDASLAIYQGNGVSILLFKGMQSDCSKKNASSRSIPVI